MGYFQKIGLIVAIIALPLSEGKGLYGNSQDAVADFLLSKFEGQMIDANYNGEKVKMISAQTSDVPSFLRSMDDLLGKKFFLQKTPAATGVIVTLWDRTFGPVSALQATSKSHYQISVLQMSGHSNAQILATPIADIKAALSSRPQDIFERDAFSVFIQTPKLSQVLRFPTLSHETLSGSCAGLNSKDIEKVMAKDGWLPIQNVKDKKQPIVESSVLPSVTSLVYRRDDGVVALNKSIAPQSALSVCSIVKFTQHANLSRILNNNKEGGRKS